MSNMTVNQRTQFDRVDLNAPTTGTLAGAEEWIARYADRVLTRL